jgi:hypothetical protein
MEQEAKKLGLSLSQSKLAELQPLAGRNPMLARKVVQRQKLGMIARPGAAHAIRCDYANHSRGVVFVCGGAFHWVGHE